MKQTIQKIGVISGALLTLALNVNAQWTETATSVYLTNGTKLVGVGTNAPSYPLDIKQDGNCSFRVQSKVNGSSNMILSRPATTSSCLVNYKTVNANVWLTGVTSGDDFRIRNAGGVDNLLISQATGNIGIGTTAPISKLDVRGQVNVEFADALGNYTSTTIRAKAINGSAYVAGLSLYTDQLADGVLLYASNGGGLLVYDDGGASYAPVAASAFNVNSDITLKKDINPVGLSDFENYMNQIRKIDAITYFYKDETSDLTKAANPSKVRTEPHVGFSAQSLPIAIQAKMPVSGKINAETKLGYNLSDMAGLTLIGVKALDAKTQALEAENLAKDVRINDLEKRLSDMNDCIQSLCNANTSKVGATEINISNLFQNSPNPFNQTTVIRYALSSDANSGKIIIRDLNGNLVKQISIAQSGKGQVTINANELSQGTYTYTLEIAGASVDTKLMVVTK